MNKLNKTIQQHFEGNMQQHTLFRVDITGRQVWDDYMAGSTNKTDPKFRDQLEKLRK